MLSGEIALKNNHCYYYYYVYIYKRSSTMKIGVERVNQASKLTRTEVNDIVDVSVICVQIVEQVLSQSPRSALSTA